MYPHLSKATATIFERSLRRNLVPLHLTDYDFPSIFLQTITKKQIPPAHKRLLIKMGIRIQSPGNHCLEYQDRAMIGKCNIRVAATRVCIPNVGIDCAAFRAPATDMVIGMIKTLNPK